MNKPAPATEYRGSPEQFHGDTYDPRKDKPPPATAEWTNDMVIMMGVDDYDVAVAIRDKHNAALTAERERFRMHTRNWDAMLQAKQQQLDAAVEALEKIENWALDARQCKKVADFALAKHREGKP